MKKFDELFVEDRALDSRLANNDENCFGERLSGDLALRSIKKITEDNWTDYIYFMVANTGYGDEDFADFAHRELNCYKRSEESDEAYAERVCAACRRLYSFGEIVDFIERAVKHYNYEEVKRVLGENWAYIYGVHSEVECVAELSDSIVQNGDVDALLDSYEHYDEHVDADYFMSKGVEALEDLVDYDCACNDAGELDWEELMENGYVNMFHVYWAFEHDAAVVKKYYNRLDAAGREAVKKSVLRARVLGAI